MPNKQNIVFSVIVPVYEHWHNIPALITCLQKQLVEQSVFEVLLVDNGSSNFTPPSQLPSNVHIFKCYTQGSYAARNYGVNHAKGTWLVFTDADCLPTEDWLRSLLTHINDLNDHNVILAGGIRMRPRNLSPTIYEMYDLVKGIPQKWYVSRGYAVTANLAVSVKLFNHLGGFDSSRYSGGDSDFSRRAVSTGADLRYVEFAVVEHPARDTWCDIAVKARRIKGGQLTSGSKGQQKKWLLRTITPPFIAFSRFLRMRDYPLRYRVVAIIIQIRIWMIELHEAYCLIFYDKKPERR